MEPVGRPWGTKNPEYAARRAALADAARARLLADGGATSLHELAEAAGVSVPTLRHYFGDRAGVVAAALRREEVAAAPHLSRLAAPSSSDLTESLTGFLRELVAAWGRYGVGRVFTVGLVVGAYDVEAGPAYLDGVLEPTLQAIEARLAGHAAAGALRIAAGDAEGLRAAALSLVAPVLVGLIHQDALGGAACRRLDLNAFVATHVAGFVRAYGPAPRRPRTPSTGATRRR